MERRQRHLAEWALDRWSGDTSDLDLEPTATLVEDEDEPGAEDAVAAMTLDG